MTELLIFILLIALEMALAQYISMTVKNIVYSSGISSLIVGILGVLATHRYISTSIPLKPLLIWIIFTTTFSTILNWYAVKFLNEPSIIEKLLKECNIYATSAILLIVAPFSEEILFRGLLLDGLTELLPPWIAIITSSLVFTTLHIGSFWDNSKLYKVFQLTGIFILSVALSHLFISYHNLTLNIIVHGATNIPGLLFVYREKHKNHNMVGHKYNQNTSTTSNKGNAQIDATK